MTPSLDRRKHERINLIHPILRKYNYGVSTGDLFYKSLKTLDAALKYLQDTPRVTPIGRTLTEADAAKIIGGTCRVRGDLRLAMKFDGLDNQYNKLAASARNAGFELSLDIPDGSPESLILSAVIYAEDMVFERFNYHPHAKGKEVKLLYKYIAKNPTLAYRIMEIAKARYSLDAGLIAQTLELENTTLESGVL